MAFWGAPLDDPEHARNAVACALDMADELAAFKAELGEAGAASTWASACIPGRRWWA
jgi:adenylate cyclase